MEIKESSCREKDASPLVNRNFKCLDMKIDFLKFHLGRPTTTNDLSPPSSSSSSSSSGSTNSHSIKRSRKQRNSSLSDDSLSDRKPSRIRSNSNSVYLIEVPNENSFGLTKSQVYLWKNTNSNDENETNYSIEQIQPNSNCSKRSMTISSRHVILQRGQIDYWQNCDLSADAIITSSCQKSTGSASHLLPQTTDNNFDRTTGHIISITTTKRQQPSLLNQAKHIHWNIEHDGKQTRYSRTNDEFKSNQLEIIDQINVRSQVIVDSAVEMLSEQKFYQLSNRNQIIDEQSSEDQNDLFALSDDSSVESLNKNHQSDDLSRSFLVIEKDLYSGYELETITDEEDDEQANKSTSNELILTPEIRPTKTPPTAPSSVPTIPPQFEFKLPTFGEWIDRVFTNFLTETSPNSPPLIDSSRSSSMMSIPNSQSTMNTSSSSQAVTVVENENFNRTSREDDEHSLNGKSINSLC